MEFKVGDSVWYVAGYRGDALLAILCKIQEVDDYFRKKHPEAILFYWLDEPIGHSLAADEFFLTREEAELDIQDRAKMEDLEGMDPLDENAELDKFRESSLRFILSTWNKGKDTEESVKEMLNSYPRKERGKQWFNLADLKHGKPHGD